MRDIQLINLISERLVQHLRGILWKFSTAELKRQISAAISQMPLTPDRNKSTSSRTDRPKCINGPLVPQSDRINKTIQVAACYPIRIFSRSPRSRDRGPRIVCVCECTECTYVEIHRELDRGIRERERTERVLSDRNNLHSFHRGWILWTFTGNSLRN